MTKGRPQHKHLGVAIQGRSRRHSSHHIPWRAISQIERQPAHFRGNSRSSRECHTWRQTRQAECSGNTRVILSRLEDFKAWTQSGTFRDYRVLAQTSTLQLRSSFGGMKLSLKGEAGCAARAALPHRFGAHKAVFKQGHLTERMRSTMARAKSEQRTSLAPSIWRAKS